MKKRKQFTREFKLEAVRLLEEGRKPAADLAESWVSEGIYSTNGKIRLIKKVTMLFLERVSVQESRHKYQKLLD